MSVKYTRGYYLRGFSAIGIAAAIAVLAGPPALPGEIRGAIYFVTFAIALGTLETIARRRGWPSRIIKGT